MLMKMRLRTIRTEWRSKTSALLTPSPEVCPQAIYRLTPMDGFYAWTPSQSALPVSVLAYIHSLKLSRTFNDMTCVASAGMRLGWLTGSPAMIERMQRIAETDSQEVK